MPLRRRPDRTEADRALARLRRRRERQDQTEEGSRRLGQQALRLARAVLDRREVEALYHARQESQSRQVAAPPLWADAGWMQ